MKFALRSVHYHKGRYVYFIVRTVHDAKVEEGKVDQGGKYKKSMKLYSGTVTFNGKKREVWVYDNPAHSWTLAPVSDAYRYFTPKAKKK